MIITQYAAAIQADVTPAAIYKQKKKNPIPGFFVETKDKGWMVDDQHPEWKRYLANLEDARNPTDLSIYAKKELERRENILFSAVYSVLSSELEIDVESLRELLNKIEKKYDENKKV
jgi:hypothetical protein